MSCKEKKEEMEKEEAKENEAAEATTTVSEKERLGLLIELDSK